MSNSRSIILAIAALLALSSALHAADDGLPVESPAKCLASGPTMTPAKCLVNYAQTRFVLCSFSMTGLRLGLKQALTKDYYAYWLSAMGSLIPGAEREAAWRARADKMQFELIQLGNRLKLEN